MGMDPVLYEGVPAPEDQFAADDAISQLVDRLRAAGYAYEQAPVKVAALVRQLLRAWGVPVETSERELFESNPPGSLSAREALELRRAWAGDES